MIVGLRRHGYARLLINGLHILVDYRLLFRVSAAGRDTPFPSLPLRFIDTIDTYYYLRQPMILAELRCHAARADAGHADASHMTIRAAAIVFDSAIDV